MLAPIWTDRPAMARKVRQWVGTVLHFAQSKGWREHQIPTKTITMGLARQSAGGNFAAMPYADVPAFFSSLSAKRTTAGRAALMFIILTAARSGELRSARWGHIDIERREWNRPAELMKNRLPHTITLNGPAIALLEQLKTEGDPKAEKLVFPGPAGNVMSNMTLPKVLKTAGCDFTVHGFRSAFRDWAAECMPAVPDPVAEAALAHVVPDQVVRAYKRTSFVEMRRSLLDAWGNYVSA
jgi:integrase